MCSRPLETRSRPRFLAATLATLPSMSLFPKAPFDLSVCLDHSHCPVLAPATLAASPSTRAIETRSLPTSLAATHRDFAFYVAFPESSIPDRDMFYACHDVASAKAGRPTPVGS